MARPRTPLDAAKATGADAKNPQRYRDRKEPKVEALGEPPKHLDDEARAEWRRLAADIPWLGRSDRAIVESAALLMARRTAGDLPASLYGELRQTLTQLGATPATRSRISAPNGEDEGDDPASEFLN